MRLKRPTKKTIQAPRELGVDEAAVASQQTAEETDLTIEQESSREVEALEVSHDHQYLAWLTLRSASLTHRKDTTQVYGPLDPL